jgi:hypothetical protein
MPLEQLAKTETTAAISQLKELRKNPSHQFSLSAFEISFLANDVLKFFRWF